MTKNVKYRNNLCLKNFIMLLIQIFNNNFIKKQKALILISPRLFCFYYTYIIFLLHLCYIFEFLPKNSSTSSQWQHSQKSLVPVTWYQWQKVVKVCPILKTGLSPNENVTNKIFLRLVLHLRYCYQKLYNLQLLQRLVRFLPLLFLNLLLLSFFYHSCYLLLLLLPLFLFLIY